MSTSSRVLASLLLALALLPLEALAQEYRGIATVQDGDGLYLELADGQSITIRLFGIDAPESTQHCARSDGTEFRCGRLATAELERVAAGYPAVCQVESQDRYKRKVATCTSNGVDLGRHMVATGYARAYGRYSGRYLEEERKARSRRAGFWSGSWQAPWDWRREKKRKSRAGEGRRP